jgi:ribosomal protein S18 acetylase RimI-like enzyme
MPRDSFVTHHIQKSATRSNRATSTRESVQPVTSSIAAKMPRSSSSNLMQIPVEAALQQKPDKAVAQRQYRIAAPKSSDDGYREITAIATDTQKQVGRVKIKGLPVQQKIEIASLWVNPEHRQQGVSKSLLSAAMNEGKKQGYPQAMLGVSPEAPGMNSTTLTGIYAKQGFNQIGTIDQKYPLMERSL